MKFASAKLGVLSVLFPLLSCGGQRGAVAQLEEEQTDTLMERSENLEFSLAAPSAKVIAAKKKILWLELISPELAKKNLRKDGLPQVSSGENLLVRGFQLLGSEILLLKAGETVWKSDLNETNLDLKRGDSNSGLQKSTGRQYFNVNLPIELMEGQFDVVVRKKDKAQEMEEKYPLPLVVTSPPFVFRYWKYHGYLSAKQKYREAVIKPDPSLGVASDFYVHRLEVMKNGVVKRYELVKDRENDWNLWGRYFVEAGHRISLKASAGAKIPKSPDEPGVRSVSFVISLGKKIVEKSSFTQEILDSFQLVKREGGKCFKVKKLAMGFAVDYFSAATEDNEEVQGHSEQPLERDEQENFELEAPCTLELTPEADRVLKEGRPVLGNFR
jgi:hypothetical protein